MLQLAPHQIANLDDQAVQRYLNKLDAFLLQHFPERLQHHQEDARLLLWREAMNRAMARGIRSEQGICLYATLILQVGYPRLDEMLDAQARVGDIDIDLVYQHVVSISPKGSNVDQR